VASHTIAETYAVLSTLPIKPRISPSVAWRLINENIVSIGKIVSLTPAEYGFTIKQISELGLVGGITYDALIAKVAQKSKVERMLTLNIEHFTRVWPDGEKIISLP
jgi:predicted nucleic acid-binding protein